MEQKRILWSVATVGIFLLVVVGASLLLYAPQNNADPVMIVKSQSDTWVNPAMEALLAAQDTSDQTEVTTQDPAITPSSLISVDTTVIDTPPPSVATTTLQTNDVTVISKGTTTVYATGGTTTIDLSATTTANSTESPVQSNKAVTAVTTRLPSTPSAAPKVASTPAPKVASTPAPKVASTPAPKVASTPAPKVASTASSTPMTKLVPAKKTVAALVVPKAPVDQYWVQAASFVSKSNAENARSALSSEKIPAEVFTFADTTGLIYYRLRVGPYATKSEAEYWNIRIKLIDNFATTESYVTNSTAPQA